MRGAHHLLQHPFPEEQSAVYVTTLQAQLQEAGSPRAQVADSQPSSLVQSLHCTPPPTTGSLPGTTSNNNRDQTALLLPALPQVLLGTPRTWPRP